MRTAHALWLFALAAPTTPASAQLDQTGWSALGVNEAVRSNYYADSHVTPTLRRQRTARALALRAEAWRLQAADGGTLSPRNIAYIRKKANAIRSGNALRNFGNGRIRT